MSRQTRIGGSEIAILTGMHPFGKTPLDLFKSKMELSIQKDIDAFYWGHALEPVVLERFRQSMEGYDIIAGPDAMTEQIEGEEPWQGTSPDGYVLNKDGIVVDIIEIKTTSMERWTKCPEEYRLQMLWNIGITRQTHPECKGCWMPSLHNTNRYQCKYYGYDELGGDYGFNKLNNLAKEFYENHLMTGIAPNPTKYEESVEAYRLAKGILDVTDDELDKILYYVYALEQEESKLEQTQANISKIKFNLSEMMGSYSKIVYKGKTIMSRVSSHGRASYIKVNKGVQIYEHNN